jgi:GT2 family glycosyltransferase
VHNGERWLDAAVKAILAQHDGRPFEVVAVDDRSTDGSQAILRRHAAQGRIRVIEGEGRGAAAAMNLGIRHAVYPIICQVDQDVIVGPAWMSRLADAVAARGVAAAQGYYATPRDGSVWARAMGLDLEHRYARIEGTDIDHVCTGNSAYRAEAIHKVGLFDESLGYGYDNDMSYRLAEAGYRLAFCRDARSVHRWRETMTSYLVQQYGVGYGRLDLVAKHRRRIRGDDVSGLRMIVHAPAMLGILVGIAAAVVLGIAGRPWVPVALPSAALLGLLVMDRLAAGIAAAVRFRDAAALAFVPIHLIRDIAWAAALTVWAIRRALGRRPRPRDSMR